MLFSLDTGGSVPHGFWGVLLGNINCSLHARLGTVVVFAAIRLGEALRRPAGEQPSRTGAGTRSRRGVAPTGT